MNRKILRNLATTVLLSALTVSATATAADERPVIGIENKTSVKVVIQMTGGKIANGVNADLAKVNKIYQDYLEEGVAPDAIDIRVVIHGDAAEHVLTDAAWNHHRSDTTGNPNTQLIADLATRGVHLELCNSRRLRNGWEKSEIHSDVALVGNAYLRLADLQNQGYSYVQL